MIISIPDIRIFIGRVLQLDNRNGQAIDEHHHIRAPVHLRALHRELIDHQKPVVIHPVEINQPHMLVLFLTSLPVNDRHTFQQQFVECMIALDQHRKLRLGDPGGHLLQLFNRYGGIYDLQGA